MNNKTYKVMLVEDDPAIVDIYKIIFQKEHFDIETYGSGEEAVRAIKSMASGEKEKPDIILLDLVLPDMNGADIFREIKKDSATKSIVVFVLTNQENPDEQWADDQKPDRFLIKAHVSPTQLVEIVTKTLK